MYHLTCLGTDEVGVLWRLTYHVSASAIVAHDHVVAGRHAQQHQLADEFAFRGIVCKIAAQCVRCMEQPRLSAEDEAKIRPVT